MHTVLKKSECEVGGDSESKGRFMVQLRSSVGSRNGTIANQYISTSRRSRDSRRTFNPPIARLLILVAKFLGPSSSAPEGGPRGCLVGCAVNLDICGVGIGTTAGAGLPIPSPSYNFFVASSRGDRGISFEDGVVGEPFDLDDELEDPSSPSVSDESIAMTGKDCDSVLSNRRGCGRYLTAPANDWEGAFSSGGGVTLTVGEGRVMARLALRTELLLPLRLQDPGELDLDGMAEPILMLLDVGLPITVPPLMTVVRLGGADERGTSIVSSSPSLRLPNLLLNVEVIDSSVWERPSFDLSCSAWLPRILLLLTAEKRRS